jgi:hypothetical protein
MEYERMEGCRIPILGLQYYNNKKDTGKKSHREIKELTWDKEEWSAAVSQSYDCNTIVVG